MRAASFSAMGTSWWISSDVPALHAEAEALVRDVEARLSRFRPDSALTRLNVERSATDPVLAAVTRVALDLRSLTDGAFDPTLGARLAELGYDRSFSELVAPRHVSPFDGRRPRATVQRDRVRLEGPGDLDLGGVAKGWTVDRVVDLLRERGARNAVVDGGGDLRVLGGPFPIGVGEDLDLDVSDGAVVTSSTRERRWRTDCGTELHHVLDPRTGAPSTAPVDTATVSAPDAATADGLATALLVDPAPLVPRLRGLGARAALRGRDGRWWTTPDWQDRT